MKKHLFILVLALLLAAFTSAAAAQEYYTLPEIREQAANGWHQTYTDKYGRTRQVDVDIEVFGEDAAPVIKACWNAEHFDFVGSAGEPRLANQTARKKGNGEDVYLYAEVPFMKVNLDEKYVESCENALSLRKAYDFCEEILQGHSMSLYQNYLWDQPKGFEALYTADKDTGEVLVPGMYSLRFCQKELGMPILTYLLNSFNHTSAPFIYPFLNFQMRDQESYSFSGYTFDVAEVLAEDIPLCPIDKVIEGARAMIENGYIYDVRGLRFGLVVYGDPKLDWTKKFTAFDVENWYLVPSWVLDCRVLWNPKEEDPEESYDSEIIINAQTGEMIDYFDTSLNGGGDVRYKGFISWDDVK